MLILWRKAPVMQCLAQKGSLSSLSTHKSHFSIFPVSELNHMACIGHASIQILHPVHKDLSITTTPSSRFLKASLGHTLIHWGFSHCVHLIILILIMILPFALYFDSISSTLILNTPGGRLLICLHATSHEWHPMQRFGVDISIFPRTRPYISCIICLS